MQQDRLAFLALHFIPGIGNQLIKQLISYGGSPEDVFQLPKGKLQKIPGIGPVTADAIKSSATFSDAEKMLRLAEKENTTLLFYTDKAFPRRLREIDDAPTLLYCQGNLDLQFKKSVAIVGTRQATDYGKEITAQIISDLKPHGAVIVSGLAYGIDIQAHKQALKVGLPTVAVMGSGMNIIYPSAHKDTAKKITTHGALLTENHFGVKPDAHLFPARNRIIAGLCDALIVVEAAEKGGALITAEIANTYNKDVFAVPGSLGETYSEGCNRLIRSNKASIYTSIKDLEYLMNWSVDQPETPSAAVSFAEFGSDEQTVLRIMANKGAPMAIDELTLKTNLSPGQLASLLLQLEFQQVIRALPGKLFTLAR